jgi:hypothetical protein
MSRTRIYLSPESAARIAAVQESYVKRGLIAPSTQQIADKALSSGLTTLELEGK